MLHCLDHRWKGKKRTLLFSLCVDVSLTNFFLCFHFSLLKINEKFFWVQLVELEKLLREETKLRDKAERRLKFLKNKVGSFSIPSKSGQLEHSDSSEKSENSCGSSRISSLSKHSKENEKKHDAKIPALPENIDHSDNVSEASTVIQTHNGPSSTRDCDSQNNDNFSSNSDPVDSSLQILNENPNLVSGNLKNDESRYKFQHFYGILLCFQRGNALYKKKKIHL